MNRSSLLEHLQSQCNTGEFKWLIFENGSRGAFDYTKRTETITDISSEKTVKIIYNKKHKVSEIWVNDELNEAEIAIRVNRDLIENQKVMYGQRIAYSNNKVMNSYRLMDLFQLLPIETDREESVIILAGNPFSFEFTFLGSTNAHINIHRAENTARHWITLLNIWLRDSIKLGPRYMQQEWFFDTQTQKNSIASVGFFDITKPGLIETFSNPQPENVIPLFVSPDYYKDMLLMTFNELQVPAHLPSFVLAFNKLGVVEKEAYLLSASWFADAQRIFSISSSACLNSLVTAIECMLPKDSEICSSCNQDKFGVGRKFNEFLDCYAPMEKGIDSTKRFREVYATRSKLAHGAHKYIHDLISGEFGYETSREDHELRTMIQVVKTALINWIGRRIS
jgi:hypothetical protein